MKIKNLNFYKNLILAVIPKKYWIAFFVCIVFKSIGGDFNAFSNIILNVILFFTSIKVATIIHEVGHLAMAKLAGGTPRRMEIGISHKLFQSYIKGVKIIINSKLSSGMAYAAFENIKFIRIKLFLFTIGGPFTNILFGTTLYYFFGFETSLYNNTQFAATIGIANISIGLGNLLPFYFNHHGIRMYSDGLALLKIPFHSKEYLSQHTYVNEALDANDLFEEKKYSESIEAFESILKKYKNLHSLNINLSIAYLKIGNFQKAMDILENLLPIIEEESLIKYKGYIYNSLAWNYLLLERLEEADTYSSLAYNLGADTEAIRGTRATILIEKGEYEKGKALIINDVNFNYPNSNTLCAAIYLTLACQESGELDKANKYLEFVDTNKKILDLDELHLYNRIKLKLDKTEEIYA